MGFFRDLAEEVGKWIPNEISKTNSLSKYTQLIPVVGPAVSGVQRGVSAVDNFATAYGDDASLKIAFRGGMMGAMGQSASPGDSATGFYNTSGRDFFDVAGQVGNFLPSYGSDGFKVGPNDYQRYRRMFRNPVLFGDGEGGHQPYVRSADRIIANAPWVSQHRPGSLTPPQISNVQPPWRR